MASINKSKGWTTYKGFEFTRRKLVVLPSDTNYLKGATMMLMGAAETGEKKAPVE